MRSNAALQRHRTVRIGVPAAVVGAIAGVLSPVSASAAPTPAEHRQLGSLPRPTAKPEVPDEYVVRTGDTVSAIAGRFGLRTADVLERNGLGWSTLIHPGQRLRLTARAAQAPAVQAPAEASAPAPAVHTVVSGDTVFAIAQRNGTTVDAILAANGLERSSIIYPGQRLLVAAATAAPAVAETAATQTTELDAEQAENAAAIIRIGRELGVPDRGIAIALGTAMVESWLRNLDWGDRDSLGLFQQRPSTGWGSAEQIQDRERSIRAFFGGTQDPNGTNTRGLLDIAGWEDMDYADAAQAVQISAHPGRYAPWEDRAARWIELYG